MPLLPTVCLDSNNTRDVQKYMHNAIYARYRWHEENFWRLGGLMITLAGFKAARRQAPP